MNGDNLPDFKGKFNACFDKDHVFTTASLEGVPNQ